MTAFWRAGANMTISSDDPPFFGTTLTDELRHLVRIAELTRDDLAELQRRARASLVCDCRDQGRAPASDRRLGVRILIAETARRIALVGVVGLTTGVLTQVLQSVLPDGWSQAANAISPWLFVAFILDRGCRIGAGRPAQAWRRSCSRWSAITR